MEHQKRVYAAEPLLINNEYSMLNYNRDIESARDFFKNKNGTYTSLDPRLYDPIRNIRLDLDRPPYQPRNVQPLQNIYSDCESNKIKAQAYPGGFEDIYGGDVYYYIDPSQCLAYDSPNYVIRSAVIPTVFEDPMGAYKPHYERVPLFKHNRNVAPYTFDQDQMSYREDLMARQSAKINQRDYNYYIGHFAPEKIETQNQKGCI